MIVAQSRSRQRPSPRGPWTRPWRTYRHYLTVERGLGKASARGYIDAVRPFLRRCVSADGLALDIDQLSEADVTAFMVTRCAEQSRRAAQQTATALRSLVGFLHVNGAITHSLAAAVPSVAGRRLAGLPPRLEPDDVRRLLAACDRRTLAGLRDFAVITTLARLGLRAGEVATLGLDDLQWRLGELVVHGKGSKVERLPLPTNVGPRLRVDARPAWAPRSPGVVLGVTQRPRPRPAGPRRPTVTAGASSASSLPLGRSVASA